MFSFSFFLSEKTHKMAYLVYTFLVAVLNIFLTVQGEVGNITKAHNACLANGGIPDLGQHVHNVANAPEKVITVLDNKPDNTSTWIVGKARYSSHFVAWHGCFSITSLPEHLMESSNDVFWCLEVCTKDNHYEYIGIRDKTCTCVSSSMRRNTAYVRVKNETLCQLDRVLFPHSGGLSDQNIMKLFSVYQIVRNMRISDRISGQCVFFQQKMELWQGDTDSCHKTVADNALCKNRADMEATCNKTRGTQVCILNTSMSWTQAFKTCRKHNGVLSSINSIFNLDKQINVGKSRYWTGIYRPFSPFENGSHCLAVTKINGKISLEAMPCSEKLDIICAKEHTTKATNVSTRFNTSKSNRPESSGFPWYLYILLACVCLAILGVIVLIVAKKRKAKSRKAILQDESDIRAIGIIPHESATTDKLQEQEGGEITATDSFKSKPSKPIRRTLKRQNAELVYENFKVVETLSDKGSDEMLLDSPYDNVQFHDSKLQVTVADGGELLTMESDKKNNSSDADGDHYNHRNLQASVSEHTDLENCTVVLNSCVVENEDGLEMECHDNVYEEVKTEGGKIKW